MRERFRKALCQSLNCSDFVERETIQSLWSGYGRIVRIELLGGPLKSVVVKLVRIPSKKEHPHGWNTDRSHQRKIKSYEVEAAWYADFASRCGPRCRVPLCYAVEKEGSEVMLALEDLDAAGFAQRRDVASLQDMQACLGWLAEFHATFMGESAKGLWTKGTYWHLDTRPDELAALDDGSLKAAAGAIDRVLDECRFKTIVHGDTKLANFCFSDEGGRVAAVDFQYVGGGCGMKDVAYFVGSCLGETECERMEADLLAYYFASLRQALSAGESGIEFEELRQEWLALYPVAWTDFHRFLKGWSPGHWKVHSYSERLAREVVQALSR